LRFSQKQSDEFERLRTLFFKIHGETERIIEKAKTIKDNFKNQV